MAYFVVIGRDKPGASELRNALRPSHQAHFSTPQFECVGVAGGPLLDDAQEAMIGTLLVFEAVDRAAVESFFAKDPYTMGGLFETVKIVPWRWGLGRPPSVLPAAPAEAG